MEAQFWRDKWIANQIGFHEDSTHPMLQRHWRSLNIESVERIFVPLCGKSKDMMYLCSLGHHVIGLELSEIAIDAFLAENEITAKREEIGDFVRYSADDYTLYCGDIFKFDSSVCGAFGGLYDRAALIALPPEMRTDYVAKLRSLCSAGTRGLLVTVTYPPEEIKPPPFAVPNNEVNALYKPWCEIEILGTGVADVKGFAGSESAFALTVR